MSFRFIRGTFSAHEATVTGGSIAFRAASRESWKLLSGPPPQMNSDCFVRLRLEGLDAPQYLRCNDLERTLEPQLCAENATGFLLKALGFEEIDWAFDMQGTRLPPSGHLPERAGYILANSVDRSGRPVAFAYVDDCGLGDGSSQELNLDWLKHSLNYGLVSSGMAYPTYYEPICEFVDLRDAISAAARQASSARLGLWRADCSRGFSVEGFSSIKRNGVVFPKLLRRILTYLSQNNDEILGFKGWLKEKNEKLLVLSIGFMGTFDQVIRQSERRISMTTTSDDLVFRP